MQQSSPIRDQSTRHVQIGFCALVVRHRNGTKKNRVERLQALLPIEHEYFLNSLSADVWFIVVAEILVPSDLFHEPASFDLVLRAPEKQRLDRIVAHQAV